MTDSWVQYVIGPAVVAVVGLVGILATRRDARAAHERGKESPQGISTADQATIAGLVTTVGHLAGRVEDLEGRVTRSERLAQVAAGYASRLLDFISHHLPGRDDVPAPPEELREHLPH